MPLKCIRNDEDNQVIFSFDYIIEDWNLLKEKNKKIKHLNMHCCGANTILKTSKLGTQFFAHAKGGDCFVQKETAEHLHAKNIIACAIRKAGWIVDIEHAGQTAAGEKWIADVIAISEKAKIAFEVQWSRQDDIETLRRQERYRESGVRALWLMRQYAFPLEKATPAFRLCYEEAENNFSVLLPSIKSRVFLNARNKDDPIYWQQSISLQDFIFGALHGCLKFAPALGVSMPVDIHGSSAECWRCHKQTTLITGIYYQVGQVFPDHQEVEVSIYDFSEEDNTSPLLKELFPQDLRAQHQIGSIKPRYSKTQGEAYMSNGCFHCDALMGRFFDHDYCYDAEKLYTINSVLHDSLVQPEEWEDSQVNLWWFDRQKLEFLLK
ncbi:hypothetical protein ACFQNF_19730 [Iodobacter arcticus]|uniref:Competence protein CoiA nuclease-like domain-containing protein n=1 Tax=Iodobacter arcticus TaxID=590593 RepID=A0ABW2R460_9NEIS